MFLTSIYGLFRQELGTPNYWNSWFHNKNWTEGLAEHNRCPIHHYSKVPILVLVLVEQRGRGADKGKNSGTYHRTCLTSPLGTGHKLVRVLEEREVNIVGYVPRQLGHGMGTKFLKEVLDNCILAAPGRWKEGRDIRQTKKLYDIGMLSNSLVLDFSQKQPPNQGKVGWQPSVSFKMRPTDSCSLVTAIFQEIHTTDREPQIGWWVIGIKSLVLPGS